MEVHDQLQQNVDLWEGGIKATGGALVPRKSNFYLINFLWDHDKPTYGTDLDPKDFG